MVSLVATSSVPNLPADRTMVRRILATYERATDAERAEGLVWYRDALGIATDLARVHGTDVVTAAAVIAVLSPRTGWSENVRRANVALADVDQLRTLSDQLRKVRRILSGERPTDVLGGSKVRAFFACILGSHETVCVDRHAVAIVYGRPLADPEVKVLERAGNYDRVAAAYVAAGRTLGIAPSAVQAATWLAWRREHDRTWYSVGTKSQMGA